MHNILVQMYANAENQCVTSSFIKIQIASTNQLYT